MTPDAAAAADLQLAAFDPRKDTAKRIDAAVPLDKTWFSRPFVWQCTAVLGFVLLQSPWYILKWLCSLLQLPAYLSKGRSPTDQDVVDVIEGTGLCMLLSRVADGSQSGEVFKFEFKNCQLMLAGRLLKSLSVVYKKSPKGIPGKGVDAEIVCCQRNGKTITSREQIYASLVAYFAGGQHPKLHVMGANLISKLDNTADPHANSILAACKYNTTPLHIFLMHTPFSPIDNSWLARFVGLYDIAFCKMSVAAEAMNMADMVNHKDKMQLLVSLGNRYTHFLVHSRDALLKVMKDHGIDLKLFEMLWLHCIAHALDHHAIADLVLSNKLLFGISNIWQDASTDHQIRTFMFARLFAQEVLAPFPGLSNRMADVAQGNSWVVCLTPAAVAFWKGLYTSLHALDAEFAAHMTASIMY